MLSLEDTIAVMATAPGEGGIGIVKISGPQARAILRRLFVPGRPDAEPPAGDGPAPPRALRYGTVRHPSTGASVDEVLAVWMPAPHTYTRQDVAEIHCHGGAAAVRAVLALALEQGTRLAEPGEMTLRAFLNGRVDLAQAEAVLGIVQASTSLGLQVAVAQLAGGLSTEVRRLRDLLLVLQAHLEASLDFPEDEIPPCDIPTALAEAQAGLQRLLREADTGILYREGVRTAIVGRPNVGKSSLLNALLRANRAIVTAIPGTTRDTLEEPLNVRGVPLVLVDTAGIHSQAQDLVERLGIERSRAALAQADLVLWVVDASAPLAPADREIEALLAGKRAIVVLNKADLPPQADAAEILPGVPHLWVSALLGTGLAELEEEILRQVLREGVKAEALPRVSQVRHKELLRQALGHVAAAAEAHQAGLAADFVSIDAAAALHALGQITGETASEGLLETIFSRFCLGK